MHSADGPAKYDIFWYDWSMRECWGRKLHGVELGHFGLSASRLYRVWRCEQGLHGINDVCQHDARDERQPHAAGRVHADWALDFDGDHSLLEHGLYLDSIWVECDLHGDIDHDDCSLQRDMCGHVMRW